MTLPHLARQALHGEIDIEQQPAACVVANHALNPKERSDALAARQAVVNAGLGDQVFVGGVDAMQPAIQAVADGQLVATARNSATRIHGWAVIAGAYAATVGLEQARAEVPFFVLADGPAIYGDIDTNPDLAAEPWKLNNYGLSPAAGLIWAEDQLVF